MVTNKKLPIIIVAGMTIAAVICLLCIGFSSELKSLLGYDGISIQYETELFDKSEPLDINIEMDEEEWDEMLKNATSEEYYQCDVTVNGKKYYSVGIRPKGNTSLSSIAMDDTTDRFSLKLEFDHFVNGQTCYGLDKLILNNNYADATNMKEAIIYDMFQYLGADSSLYNYAEISLNGTYWGVYLAVESVEDSFLVRNYSTQNGNLYKPDSMDMGDMKAKGFDGGDFDPENIPEGFDGGDFDPENIPEGFDGGDFDPGNVPPANEGGSENASDENSSGENNEKSKGKGFSFGGMFGSSGGANLNYTDDKLSSYDQIWDGAVTDSGKNDHKRVITALKNICSGVDLEKYMDVDNVLKYMKLTIPEK